MSIYFGEIAAILTAMCWTMTAVFFTRAGQQVGSVVVNRIRLVLAVLFLAVTHWLVLSTPFPLNAKSEQWFWLAISGIVGLVAADAFLFQSYVWIGPRLGMLLMSLAPVLATLLAWLFLGETLNSGQITGIIMTVGGIGWVVLDRDKRWVTPAENTNYLWGVMFGLGAATGQAIGLITAKKGLGGDFPALSGNLIRMISASIVMWGFTLVRGRASFTVHRFLDQPRAAANIVGGAFFGPFLGVWLSLVAVQLTQIGVASTLMALAPIFLLPVSYLIFKERFGWRAVVGTLAAVTGVALLFLT